MGLLQRLFTKVDHTLISTFLSFSVLLLQSKISPTPKDKRISTLPIHSLFIPPPIRAQTHHLLHPSKIKKQTFQFEQYPQTIPIKFFNSNNLRNKPHPKTNTTPSAQKTNWVGCLCVGIVVFLLHFHRRHHHLNLRPIKKIIKKQTFQIEQYPQKIFTNFTDKT